MIKPTIYQSSVKLVIANSDTTIILVTMNHNRQFGEHVSILVCELVN